MEKRTFVIREHEWSEEYVAEQKTLEEVCKTVATQYFLEAFASNNVGYSTLFSLRVDRKGEYFFRNKDSALVARVQLQWEYASAPDGMAQVAVPSLVDLFMYEIGWNTTDERNKFVRSFEAHYAVDCRIGGDEGTSSTLYCRTEIAKESPL